MGLPRGFAVAPHCAAGTNCRPWLAGTPLAPLAAMPTDSEVSDVRRKWVLRHVAYVNALLSDGYVDVAEESNIHWRRLVIYGGETW